MYRGGLRILSRMYVIHKSIDIDFSHHIRGHRGACINIHGHTWKFEVGLSAPDLDAEGFVVDFHRLKSDVLKPCHALLDHGLALGAPMFEEVQTELIGMGKAFLATREEMHGASSTSSPSGVSLPGARNVYPGGMKVVVFDFSPTSERLAKWLYDLSVESIQNDRVKVVYARIYETLRPVESVAEYRP
jgi:6-pyruvoyl tetrahydropterin synthase/QueD family protein